MEQSRLKFFSDNCCYICCILRKFTTNRSQFHSKLAAVISFFLEKGEAPGIDKEMFLYDPARFVAWLFGGLKVEVAKIEASVIGKITCDPLQVACYEHDGLTHFVLYDIKNQKVIYDPLERSNCVSKGVLSSYRIFFPTRYT